MRHSIIWSLFLFVAAASGSVASAATVSTDIKVALADGYRPSAASGRDANRKAAQTLAFAGVRSTSPSAAKPISSY